MGRTRGGTPGDALGLLAQGELRAAHDQARSLFDRAWPELQASLAKFFAALRVAPEIREDCGQAVILAVWRGRLGYRGTSRGALFAWLWRICQREHVGFLRRKGRASPLGGEPAEEPAASPPAADDEIEALDACLRELQPELRQVIELGYLPPS